MPTIAEVYIAQGHAQGLAEGELKGQAEILLRMLRRRFGAVPESVELRVREATGDDLDRWTDGIFDAQSLDALFADPRH
jgi:hypothetical protein